MSQAEPIQDVTAQVGPSAAQDAAQDASAAAAPAPMDTSDTPFTTTPAEDPRAPADAGNAGASAAATDDLPPPQAHVLPVPVGLSAGSVSTPGQQSLMAAASVQPPATLAAPDAAAVPSSAPLIATEALPASAADSAAAPPLAPTQAGPAAPTALPVAVGQPVAMPAQNAPGAAPSVDPAMAAHYAAYGMAYGGSPHAPHYAQGMNGFGAHQSFHPGAHQYGYTAEQIAAHYSGAMLMQDATAAHDAMQAYSAQPYSAYVYGGPENVAAYTHTQSAHTAYAGGTAAHQVRESAI